MAVVYRSGLRTNRLNLVLNELGSAAAPSIQTTGASAGSLVIGTADLSGATGVLATIPLETTPGTVSGDTLTIAGLPKTVTATANGTAAKAELRNNAGVVVVSGLTVGQASADIIVSGTVIASGQLFQVTGGTITHPS
jgi:hypothetical protein